MPRGVVVLWTFRMPSSRKKQWGPPHAGRPHQAQAHMSCTMALQAASKLATCRCGNSSMPWLWPPAAEKEGLAPRTGCPKVGIFFF